MSDPANGNTPPDQAAGSATTRRKIAARRYDERVRLLAGQLDRISTVILGGAVLAPIFQHARPRWLEIGSWITVAIVLHVAAQFVVSLLLEED